jgi:hypothetical protein
MGLWKLPKRVHLLITESEIGTPSAVMQVLKQRTARIAPHGNNASDGSHKVGDASEIKRRDPPPA